MSNVNQVSQVEGVIEYGRATATDFDLRTGTIKSPTRVDLELTLLEVRELVKGAHNEAGDIKTQYSVLMHLSLVLANGNEATVFDLSSRETYVVKSFLEQRLLDLEHLRKAENEAEVSDELRTFDADVYITLKLLLLTIREVLVGEIIDMH